MQDTQPQDIPDDNQSLEGLLPPKVARRDSERAEAPRSRRQSNLGGARLKLAVHGEVPGYHLYWCNDDNNEVAMLRSEGFTFVAPSEVSLSRGIVADEDVGDRISKYVGTKPNGEPLRAYLMKCPQDIWDEIQSASQDQADEWDSAIKAGVVGSVDNRYNPKGYETSIGRVTSR